jgi:hypothetical protein
MEQREGLTRLHSDWAYPDLLILAIHLDVHHHHHHPLHSSSQEEVREEELRSLLHPHRRRIDEEEDQVGVLRNLLHPHRQHIDEVEDQVEVLRTHLHAHRHRHRHRKRAPNRPSRSRRSLVSGDVVAEGVVGIVVEEARRTYMNGEREKVKDCQLFEDSEILFLWSKSDRRENTKERLCRVEELTRMKALD